MLSNGLMSSVCCSKNEIWRDAGTATLSFFVGVEQIK